MRKPHWPSRRTDVEIAEKIGEGIAIGAGVRLVSMILAASVASAAIAVIATEKPAFHPSFPPSAKLVAFVERHEGVRYVPYPDPGGRHICTVGAGHVLSWTVGCTQAQLRTVYSKAQVDSFLRSDLASARSCITHSFTRHLTQPQYEALVDLVFNAGCGSLRYRNVVGIIQSGEARLLPAAWEDTAVTASGVYLSGLAQRRRDEVALYAQGYYGPGIGYYIAPKPLTRLEKAELALRRKTGYWAWLGWYLHEGAWKQYAVHAPVVRPHVPIPVPKGYWKREALYLKARHS